MMYILPENGFTPFKFTGVICMCSDGNKYIFKKNSFRENSMHEKVSTRFLN